MPLRQQRCNPVQVRELTIYRLCLPLKRPIRHASFQRSDSENILVSCTLSDGTVGWGEGVPRTYVTGESVSGAVKQLSVAGIDRQLTQDCTDWSDVIAMCLAIQLPPPHEDPRGCYGNALRCAVELSILDAFGKMWDQPMSAVTHHYADAAAVRGNFHEVRYSGVITAETRQREVWSAIKMRAYGFAQCKIKVGMPGVDDSLRLRRLRRWLGQRMDLRLDANEAWKPDELCARAEPLLACSITSLEQPVPHRDVAVLAEFRRNLPVRVMLDESLTSEYDAVRAIQDQTCDLFNIRLSKCGGFLSSLRLAALAKQAGLGYQLGCHPGESSILSAAGRHFATSVANIAYLEGSYDRHILRHPLTAEDMTFAYGGRAAAIERGGLGVNVLPDRLRDLASICQTYVIE